MSNKVPCGGFYLDDMLGVDENGKLGVNGGEPYKQLVTDGDGNPKWEDRLAWSENKMELIRSTVSIKNGAPIPLLLRIIVGTKYEVILDGVKYSLVCFDDGGYPTIGAPYQDYSVYPFNIALDGTNVFFNSVEEGDSEHSLTIYEEQEDIHAIDQKFLKASYPEYEITTKYDSTGNKTYSCELSFNDAYAMGEEKLLKSIKRREAFPTFVKLGNSRTLGLVIVLKFDFYSPNSDMTVSVEEELFIWTESRLSVATRKTS